MKPGASKKVEAHRWMENDRYSGEEASQPVNIARIISGADNAVVVASPALTYDFTWEVTRSSARCYVMTSTGERLRRDIRGGTSKETLRLHEETTGKLAENALVRRSDDFGAKMVLADPKSDRSNGLFLTSDLTSESMRSGQFLSVQLSPAELREAWSLLRWAFWERATSEAVGGVTRRCKPLGKFELPKPVCILQFGPSRCRMEDKARGILGGASTEILVASTELDENHEMVRNLCELGRKGASVTVMTGTDSPVRPCAMMREANVRILGFSSFHANAIATESRALVTSAGLTRRGPDSRFEVGLSLEGERAEGVRKTMRVWATNYQYEFK